MRNYQAGVGKGRWKQGNGQIIAMAEMTERHIRNALKLCRDYGKIKEFNAELERRDRFDQGSWA